MTLIRASFVLSLVLVAACASGHYATVDPGHAAFVIPHHIAEGKGEGEDLPADAGSPVETHPAAALPPPPPLTGSAPDPEPVALREQWQYALLYEGGNVSVEHVEKHTSPKPVATVRHMGRFALELWIGHELIDRARFDFPLIAAETGPGSGRHPLHDAPSLGPHAIARMSVLIPASPRATRLVLVDRATGKAQEFPWPPDREPSAANGAPAAAPSAAAPATNTTPP